MGSRFPHVYVLLDHSVILFLLLVNVHQVAYHALLVSTRSRSGTCFADLQTCSTCWPSSDSDTSPETSAVSTAVHCAASNRRSRSSRASHVARQRPTSPPPDSPKANRNDVKLRGIGISRTLCSALYLDFRNMWRANEQQQGNLVKNESDLHVTAMRMRCALFEMIIPPLALRATTSAKR